MSTSKWADMPHHGFDVETTGVSVWEDRIVTASIVINRGLGAEPTTYEWLINPQVEIPEGATAIHGITTAHAAEHGRAPADALAEIVGILALSLHRRTPVVAMNAAFDLTMLEVECRRHGVPGLVERLGRAHIAPIIDPFVLDKYADQYRKGGRKLVDLCRVYGVDLPEDQAHNSTADTVATCQVWLRLMAKHAHKFRGMTLDQLHTAQVGWRRAQMDSLRAYFDRVGTEHDGCDPAWPLLTPPVGVTPGQVAS